MNIKINPNAPETKEALKAWETTPLDSLSYNQYSIIRNLKNSTLRLLLPLEPEIKPYIQDTRYIEIRIVVPALDDDNSPRNPSPDDTIGTISPCNLVYLITVNRWNNDNYCTVNHAIYYDNGYNLDLYDLRRMTASLETITRKLNKIDSTYGRTDDNVSKLLRYAQAIGAKEFYTQDPESSSSGWSYADHHYFLTDINPDMLGYYLNGLINKAAESLGAPLKS